MLATRAIREKGIGRLPNPNGWRSCLKESGPEFERLELHRFWLNFFIVAICCFFGIRLGAPRGSRDLK